MLHTKYKASRPCGFREKDYVCFPCISLCKTCDPMAGSLLAPGVLFKQTW